MFHYLLKRLLALIPVAFGVLIFVSLMTRLVPGDPVDVILGDYASLQEKVRLRDALGLDQNATEQLRHYVGGVMHGDLGKSFLYGRPVLAMITERVPATIRLAFASMIIALGISLPLGIISAVKKDTPIDYAAMGISIMGVALPNFWLGPLFVLLFSLEWDLLPVSGMDTWQSYVLPAVTMGTALAAALSRMTRNAMLEVLNEDYVRTARAKGCPEGDVVLVHAFRNAGLPIITVVGLQFGVLMTGAIITEKIFDWPGVGSLLLEAIQARDYPVVQGCVLVFSATYLLVNLATDMLYAAVDPRISLNR